MGNAPKRGESGGSQELSARIAEICLLLWGGNEARMARDLGISQSVTWRVVHGKQAPPGKLIENLGCDPRVDPSWLLRGKGTPLGAAIAHALPIARENLPGLPEHHQHRLCGETFSLAAHLCRPSRYWYEIQPDDTVLRSSLRLNARDLLLMETDRGAFPAPDRLAHHLCGVRITVARKTRLKLGRVDYLPGDEESGPEHIEVDLFDLVPADVKCDVVLREHHGRQIRLETYYRWGRSEQTGKKVKVPVSEHELFPPATTINYEDLVGICVLMVRRDPSGI